MDIVLIRGRENDSAVYRYFDVLKSIGSSVRLIVWNRSKSGGPVESNDDILEVRIKSPTDSLRVVFYLPLWWAIELIYLIGLKPKAIGAFDIDTSIPALLASKITKAELTYVMLDYSPDCVAPGTAKILAKVMTRIEKIMMQSANKIVLVDESRIEQVKGSKYSDKISIVHNIPLAKISTDVSSVGVRESDVITLLYAGILHESRGIRCMIDSIIEIDDLTITIAGMGPLEDYVRIKATEYPNKIKYVGQVNHEEVIKYTLCADAIIGFYDPRIRNNRFASPNRFFEAMMYSKPLITNKGISIANIIEENDSGFVIEYDNAGELQQLMKYLLSNKSELIIKGKNANRLFNSKYTLEREMGAIARAFIH